MRSSLIVDCYQETFTTIVVGHRWSKRLKLTLPSCIRKNSFQSGFLSKTRDCCTQENPALCTKAREWFLEQSHLLLHKFVRLKRLFRWKHKGEATGCADVHVQKNRFFFFFFFNLWRRTVFPVQWNQFFLVQNFVWKNYPPLIVESTSNFAWSLFWPNFSSRVIYFCQIFSASKIFLKLLLIWPGLDVFPFKMMKKEACHRVQHVKISRNWSSRFVGRLCACLKNQTFERQWKMCSTGLNA